MNKIFMPGVSRMSIMIRGVVGWERVGTAFPHLFYVLLSNDLEAVLK